MAPAKMTVRVTSRAQESKLPSHLIHHARLLLLPPLGMATLKRIGKTEMRSAAAHPGVQRREEV